MLKDTRYALLRSHTLSFNLVVVLRSGRNEADEEMQIKNARIERTAKGVSKDELSLRVAGAVIVLTLKAGQAKWAVPATYAGPAVLREVLFSRCVECCEISWQFRCFLLRRARIGCLSLRTRHGTYLNVVSCN